MAVNLSPLAIAVGSWVAGLDGKLRGADPTGALGGTPEGREAIMLALGIDVNPTPTGTTYYLDNTHGSASDSNAGTSASAPWLTMSKALTTLTAGDMVIGDGTYTHGDTCRPVNSGTLGNPVIYRAKTPRSFIVDGENAHDGFRLDDTTAETISYTVFDGLEIKNILGRQGVDGNSTGGTGGVFTKDNNISIHVLNCYIHDLDCESGTNAGGVRFDKQTGGVIYNTIIHTVRVGGIESNNAASVHGYGANEAILAFNKVYDSYHGFDTKNSLTVNDWKVIHNDVAVTGGDAIYVNVIGSGQPAVASINGEIYGNLFRNGRINYDCYEHNPQSKGLIIRNNVCLTRGIMLYEIEDVEIYDNIFPFAGSSSEAGVTITTQTRDIYSAGRVCTIIYSDYNNYVLAPTFTTNRYALNGGVEIKAMSLATWTAQSSGDGAGTILTDSPDANALTVDPQFDADYLPQNAALASAGRYGGQVGFTLKAGPDWSNI